MLLPILILVAGAPLRSQETNFQPPRPPPIDPGADFDDMEEDLMEMGDEGFRPPPPPPPPAGSAGGSPGSPPNVGFDRGHSAGAVGGGNFGSTPSAKLKFKVVEGEFWEKGKKRPRGKRSPR